MNKKRITLGILLLLVIILLFVYFITGKPTVRGLFSHGAYGTQIAMDTSYGYRTQKYDGGVAVLGMDGLSGVSDSGRIAWKIDFPATEPILACAGKYVLASARDTNRVILARGGQIKQDILTDEKIITASVNAKGMFAVVTHERGYKGCVRVYDASGKEIYIWHSAEQNILSAAVAEDGCGLAVSVINMESPSKLCTVFLFDMRKTEPIALNAGNENLAANLVFSGRELLVIGDEMMICYKSNGEEKFRVDYAGRELQDYSFYKNGVLAFAFIGGSENGTEVVFYDMNGKEKGRCAVGKPVTDLDTFGSYAAVSAEDEIIVISQSGRIVQKRRMETGMQKLFLCGSRNRVFILSGTSAGMYIL